MTVAGVKGIAISGNNCTIKQSGFEGPANGVTHHQHFTPVALGGDNNLMEDCWWFGEGRYVINAQGATNCTIRNCIGRHDGTQVDSGQPHATFSHYNCDDMIWENLLSLDYAEPDSAMPDGGCFKMSSNTDGSNQRTKWLGCASAYRSQNTSNNRGIQLDAKTGTTITDIEISDMFVRFADGTAGIFITTNSLYDGNVTVDGLTRYGGTNDGSIAMDGLCDEDAYYLNGVLQTGVNKWAQFKNVEIIRSRMAAYRNAGWAAGTKSLEDYFKAQ